MGVIINTDGGGGKKWTLLGSLNSPVSSGGAEQSTTLTVPTGATEFKVSIYDSGDLVIASATFLASEAGASLNGIRVANNAITDLVMAKFTKSTGVLRYNWWTGTLLSGTVAKVFAR